MDAPAVLRSVRKLDLRSEIVEVASRREAGFVKASVRNRDSPSKKPPQNRGNLPDNLSIGAIPKLLRAYSSSWIAMNDEIAFIESATATKIAAIPSQNQIEGFLTDGVLRGRGGFPRSTVDDNECGVDEQRMPLGLIAPHPKHIREGQTLEASDLTK